MYWIFQRFQSLLQGVPTNAVLRERTAWAEKKYEAALRENEKLRQKVEALERELRRQIPRAKEAVLSADTNGVLVYLFERNQADVGEMATALGMEENVLQYHLDRIAENGLATRTNLNSLDQKIYWHLTLGGRKRVVEGKLHLRTPVIGSR